MRYNGGKSRLAKRIVDAILTDLFFEGLTEWDTCIEPFMGGGAITTELAPHFPNYTANDVHEDVIILFKAVQEGWVPPDNMTEEDYNEIKADYLANPEAKSALRTFAGYACSWGGMWFSSYAKDKDDGEVSKYVGQGYRSLLRATPKIQHVNFVIGDYERFDPGEGTVVYCDPPYANTAGYKAAGEFDNDRFWEVAERWSRQGARVYVSEFTAPDHWDTVINISRTRVLNMANLTTVEDGLFTLRV